MTKFALTLVITGVFLPCMLAVDFDRQREKDVLNYIMVNSRSSIKTVLKVVRNNYIIVVYRERVNVQFYVLHFYSGRTERLR